MNTKAWGPKLWDFAFIMCRNYPETINPKNNTHIGLKKHYKEYFVNLKYLLPCKYCRKSYTKFLKELPLNEKYLNSRADITYWLYLIKDKVNKKLIKQERTLLRKEIKKLVKPSKAAINKLECKILYTKPSPPFQEVCAKYECHRAKCGKVKGQIDSCRSKKPAEVGGESNKAKYCKRPL